MEIGAGVENYLNQRLDSSEGLLVGLNTGGCTGYEIKFMKLPLTDIMLQNISICPKVYVETESQEILSKCTLNISEDSFSEKLTINVPKETFDMCGCANSFAPKNPLDY